MPKRKESVNIDIVTAKYDVTEAGVRLLQVLSQPETRLLTVTERCVMADISRDWYYQLQKDERWKQAYKELCDATVGQAVLGSIQTIEQAAMTDPGVAIEMLKLSGYYQPTARVEHMHTHEAGPSLKEILARRNAIT